MIGGKFTPLPAGLLLLQQLLLLLLQQLLWQYLSYRLRFTPIDYWWAPHGSHKPIFHRPGKRQVNAKRTAQNTGPELRGTVPLWLLQSCIATRQRSRTASNCEQKRVRRDTIHCHGRVRRRNMSECPCCQQVGGSPETTQTAFLPRTPHRHPSERRMLNLSPRCLPTGKTNYC